MPQPLVTVRPHSSGPPGTEITVDAAAVAGPAEVRWNTSDGPLLATAAGPSFSVPVTIPDEPDGLYSIIVLERRVGGSIGSTGRAAFLVQSPSSPPSLTSSPSQPATPSSTPNSPPPRDLGEPSSGTVTTSGAIVAGAVLLVAGGILGSLLSRRRHGRD